MEFTVLNAFLVASATVIPIALGVWVILIVIDKITDFWWS